MLRKKVACLLAAAICIGCLQGCGNNETRSLNENTEVESGEEKPAAQPDSIPTVKVCLPNYDSPADTDAVEAAINEIAKNMGYIWILNLYPQETGCSRPT